VHGDDRRRRPGAAGDALLRRVTLPLPRADRT
jgi:hypothetical protein